MSKKRWAGYTTAVMGGGYVGSIPGLSVIGGPAMKLAESLFQGNSKAGTARQVAQAFGTGAIDSAIGGATMGGYSAYQLATAWLVSIGTIYTRALDFKENYLASAATIRGNRASLNGVYQSKKDELSQRAKRKAEKQLEWLERQSRKCMSRGPDYVRIALKCERKFDEAVAKVKEKFRELEQAGHNLKEKVQRRLRR